MLGCLGRAENWEHIWIPLHGKNIIKYTKKINYYFNFWIAYFINKYAVMKNFLQNIQIYTHRLKQCSSVTKEVIWQWAAVSSETHNCSKMENNCGGYSPKLYICSPLWDSGNIKEEGPERMPGPEVREQHWKPVPSRYGTAIQQLVTCYHFITCWGGALRHPMLTEALWTINRCWCVYVCVCDFLHWCGHQ